MSRIPGANRPPRIRMTCQDIGEGSQMLFWISLLPGLEVMLPRGPAYASER